MSKQMTVGEAIRTPGTKLHAAVQAQHARNRKVDAMTDSERRAMYKRVMRGSA
jgi:hypothetical protein